MDETKHNTDTSGSEPETKTTPEVKHDDEVKMTTHEIASPAIETESAEAIAGTAVKAGAGDMVRNYVIAGVIVALILGGLWFMLEREGRVDTSLFSPKTTPTQIATVAGVAATVNGVEISNQAVADSVETLALQAQAQGVDVTNPLFQEQLRTQALETLVNTEVLRQAVAAEGIEVNAEEVQVRIAEITEQLGGEDELNSRLSEAGLTVDDLRSDLTDEIGIQLLLAMQVEPEIAEVTEEDMRALYDEFGGEEAGLPPFEEVQMQLEAELVANQQQTLILAYISTLKDSADIEISEEATDGDE